MKCHPFGLAALTWAIVGAGPAPGRAEDRELPIDRLVGRPAPLFALPDATTGQTVALRDFAGKKAAVIAFLGVDCPLGNVYLPRLVELHRQYRDRGVVFLAINANAGEPAEAVARHAREFGVDFPVLKDERNRVADSLLADQLGEVVLLDGRAVVRYRGAVDDQYTVAARRPEPTRRFLVEALDAVLAGREPETTATTVFACPIDRVADGPAKAARAPRIRPASPVIAAALKERGDDDVTVGPVTFAADVAPIVQAKCAGCHRPKQAAPFSLQGYDDLRRRAALIRDVVDTRRMPPWHADPRIGHFENDRSLTAKERATLLAWIDQGTPLGDPKALPEPPSYPDGWTVGTPDVVFTIPEQTIAAQGVEPYRHVRVPTGFTEDKWVRVIEPRPGDRTVVHHIIAYLDTHDGEPFHRRHLGGYAPGDMPSVYPEGIAKRIPAGSDLIFQLHYTPNGKIRTDRSCVGFTFAKEPPRHESITRGIANTGFVIPARADDYEVKSRLVVRDDAILLSFMPHMHLRGKDFRYTATYPDGRTEELLSVPAYDFAWQSYYRLAEPKRLPKGTRIDCVAHFDNSEANPANPAPDQPVRWGEQTWDEMMIGYVDYYLDRPADAKAATAAPARTRRPGLAALLGRRAAAPKREQERPEGPR